MRAHLRRVDELMWYAMLCMVVVMAACTIIVAACFNSEERPSQQCHIIKHAANVTVKECK